MFPLAPMIKSFRPSASLSRVLSEDMSPYNEVSSKMNNSLFLGYWLKQRDQKLSVCKIQSRISL